MSLFRILDTQMEEPYTPQATRYGPDGGAESVDPLASCPPRDGPVNTTGPIRVLVADDHASIRTMLLVFFRIEPGYTIVGQTGSGLDVLALCADLQPDIIILDLILLELSGVEVLHRVRAHSPSTRVLIYSGTQNLAAIRRCLLADPDGFVEKFEDISLLREGLRAVASGHKYFTELPSSLLKKLRKEKLDLSEREIEILQLIAEGKLTREIALRLNLAPKTVENHRSSLMYKINARNSTDLTRYAMRIGLVE
jgi:two-component system response regulator NreC